MFFNDTQHESQDRLVRASLAGLTLGISPGTQTHLVHKAMRKQLRLISWASHSTLDPDAEPCIEPLPQDRRFRDPAWRLFPTTCFTKVFYSNSSGGITLQSVYVGYHLIKNRRLSLVRANGLMCCRLQITC